MSDNTVDATVAGGQPDGMSRVDQGAVHSYDDNPGGVSIDRLVAELPPAIAAVGAGTRWQAIGVAATGTTVWRLERVGEPAMFLKVAPEVGGGAALLRAEADRLAWLSRLLADAAPHSGVDPGGSRGRFGGGPVAGISVPSVVASATDPASGEHYLATTELVGSPAARSEILTDAEALIDALASGLRALHDLPRAPCPFVVSVDGLLREAAERVRLGLVDRRQFEPIHARYSPEQLYRHLLAMRPEVPEDPVVVHGDPTLDNTLIAGGRVAGYVDLGRAGVSDRYLDLAIVARELATRVSPHALGPFFTAYGVAGPDVRKVDFYLLLDEFF